MKTIVTYNGVTIYNALTRDWNQETVYDESDTDPLFTRISMEFEGILHLGRVPVNSGIAFVNTGDSIDAGLAPGSTSDARDAQMPSAVESVQELLGEPRKEFRLYFDDKVVVQAHANSVTDEYRDLESGPKPTSVRILQVISGRVIRLRFGIKVAIGRCQRIPSDPQGVVLSNRWSVSETLDSNFFTTRTISGKMRLAGAFEKKSPHIRISPPHAFKGLVVPFLEYGFRRERIDFASEPNGLTCVYSIVDRQVHTAAPWPATDMEVVHRESTNDGITFRSMCNVRLTGDPSADKRVLMERAIQIIQARINYRGRDDTAQVESADITDYIGKSNAIDCTLTLLHVSPKTLASHLAAVRTEYLGTPLELPALLIPTGRVDDEGNTINTNLEYDPGVSRDPHFFGYRSHTEDDKVRTPAALFVLSCYLQRPCGGDHQITAVTDEDEPYQRQEEYYQPDIVSHPIGSLIEEDTDYSPSHQQSLYTFMSFGNKYSINTLRAQLPIATIARNESDDEENESDDEESVPTCEIIKLGKTVAYRVVEIDAERVGQYPNIPFPLDHYKDGEINAYLKEHDLEPSPPALAPDGKTKLFRVSGRYVYWLDRPPRIEDLIAIGVNPVTGFTSEEWSGYTLPQAIYQPGLLAGGSND